MILHSTRSGRTGDNALKEEYRLTATYFLMPSALASAHRVIGYYEGQHCECVPDDLIAWAAREYNADHLQIEMCQPMPDDPFSDFQYQCAAAVCRTWAVKYGFPLDRFHIRGHDEISAGIREGKSDPGSRWDWNRFMGLFDGR